MCRNVETCRRFDGATRLFRPKDRSRTPAFEQLPTVKLFGSKNRQPVTFSQSSTMESPESLLLIEDTETKRKKSTWSRQIQISATKKCQ